MMQDVSPKPTLPSLGPQRRETPCTPLSRRALPSEVSQYLQVVCQSPPQVALGPGGQAWE